MGGFQGLDFGPGLSSFGDVLQKGFQARQELDLQNRKLAEEMRQEDIGNQLHQQQVDYLYPKQDAILPSSVMGIVNNPNDIQAQVKAGYDLIHQEPNPNVYGPGANLGRNPSSASGVMAPGENQSDSPYTPPTAGPNAGQTLAEMAPHFGIKIDPDGTMHGNHQDVDRYFKFAESVIGQNAAALLTGAKIGAPRFARGYAEQRPGGGKTPNPNAISAEERQRNLLSKQYEKEAESIHKSSMDPFATAKKPDGMTNKEYMQSFAAREQAARDNAKKALLGQLPEQQGGKSSLQNQSFQSSPTTPSAPSVPKNDKTPPPPNPKDPYDTAIRGVMKAQKEKGRILDYWEAKDWVDSHVQKAKGQ